MCKAEVLSEGVCNRREGLLQFALLISEEPCRKRCYLEWFVDTLDVQVEQSLMYSNPVMVHEMESSVSVRPLCDSATWEAYL